MPENLPIQIPTRVFLKNLIKEPFSLMRGQKRYFWMISLPILIIGGFFVYKCYPLINETITSNLANPPSYTAALGINSIWVTLLFLFALIFFGIYAYTGSFILGCDIAKKKSFSTVRLTFISKRLGPSIISFIATDILEGLIFSIPILCYFIDFFAAPYLILYTMMVIYHKGPFDSFGKAFYIMRVNFWKIVFGYWIAMLITILLCLTIIGAIWGLPFFVTALGIMNRDLVEKTQ